MSIDHKRWSMVSFVVNYLCIMRYIEIKHDNYTFRYDFEPGVKAGPDGYVHYSEDTGSADFALAICLDLLRCCFGKEAVRKALSDLDEADW